VDVVGVDHDSVTGCSTDDPAAGASGVGTLPPEPPPLPEGEHGSSVGVVDVLPSLTVMVQVVDVKLELEMLKLPSLLAVPIRMPFTVMAAPPFAPLPWTASVVPTSDAADTRIADEPPPPPPLNIGDPDASCVAVGVASLPHARANSTSDKGTSRCMAIPLALEWKCLAGQETSEASMVPTMPAPRAVLKSFRRKTLHTRVRRERAHALASWHSTDVST
jgi:hypothetical protein